jgi:hypothetical protein
MNAVQRAHRTRQALHREQTDGQAGRDGQMGDRPAC